MGASFRNIPVLPAQVVSAQTGEASRVPGDIVYFPGAITAPSQYPFPPLKAYLAKADNASKVSGTLAYLVSGIDGSDTPASGDWIAVLLFGAVQGIDYTGGDPTVGDSVYVTDLGKPSKAPGTNSRTVGAVTVVTPAGGGAGTFDFQFVGFPAGGGGADPLAPFLLLGPDPGGLTNSVDGTALGPSGSVALAGKSASTDGQVQPLSLSNTQTAAGANGIGTILPFYATNDAISQALLGGFKFEFTDVTAGAEDSKLTLIGTSAGSMHVLGQWSAAYGLVFGDRFEAGADSSMGGNKLTAMADGTSSTDAATLGQVRTDSSTWKAIFFSGAGAPGFQGIWASGATQYAGLGSTDATGLGTPRDGATHEEVVILPAGTVQRMLIVPLVNTLGNTGATVTVSVRKNMTPASTSMSQVLNYNSTALTPIEDLNSFSVADGNAISVSLVSSVAVDAGVLYAAILVEYSRT